MPLHRICRFKLLCFACWNLVAHSLGKLWAWFTRTVWVLRTYAGFVTVLCRISKKKQKEKETKEQKVKWLKKMERYKSTRKPTLLNKHPWLKGKIPSSGSYTVDSHFLLTPVQGGMWCLFLLGFQGLSFFHLLCLPPCLYPKGPLQPSREIIRIIGRRFGWCVCGGAPIIFVHVLLIIS